MNSKTGLMLGTNSPEHRPASPLVTLPKPATCCFILLSLCHLCPFLSASAQACTTHLAPASSKRERTRVPTCNQDPQKSPSAQTRDGAAWGSHELQKPAGPHSAGSTAVCAEKQDQREGGRERSPVWTDSGPPGRSTQMGRRRSFSKGERDLHMQPQSQNCHSSVLQHLIL